QLMGMEQGKLIQDIRCAVVHVQRQHGPAQNRPGLSPAAPQVPAHKAAHILDSVLLGLCHLPVFLHCFRGGLRSADPFAEVIPGDLIILPSLLHTGISIRDLHPAIPSFSRRSSVKYRILLRSFLAFSISAAMPSETVSPNT